MTAGTHSSDHDQARLQTLRAIAIGLAIIAFGALVVGFGLSWRPWFQVPLGLAAWACIEWQRRLGQKIKELTSTRSPS